MAIKPNPIPPQPVPSNPTTGLVVSINGTQYGVTPDPPPTPGQSWSALSTTLPPLHINVDTPTQPALIVNGVITAASYQYDGPTITAESLGANANDAVYGNSANGNGVHGSSSGSSESGVLGENTEAGAGVTGSSASGNGVHGSSQSGNAGLFDGNVQVNGTLTIKATDVGQTIAALTNRIAALEQQVTKLNTHYHNYGGGPVVEPASHGYFNMLDVKNYILSATNSNGPGGNSFPSGPELDNELVELRSETSTTVQSAPQLTSPPQYGSSGSGNVGS
jgi:hypothetical protein